MSAALLALVAVGFAAGFVCELVAGVFRSSARQRRAARRLAAVPTWSRCPACGAMAELRGMEPCECEPRRELPEGPL